MSTNSRCYGSASCSLPLTRRGIPQRFCPFSLVLLGLVALSSFFWVGGVPLAVFSLPLALVAVLSSGWVGSPCRVFPVFSPWFSGGVGGFLPLRFLAISCILHLSLLGIS